MTLRALHRTSALVIVVFAAAHLANHLASLAGIAAHLQMMEMLRSVYRQPVVEALLLGCVVFQGVSGLWFVVTRWRQRRGWVAWVQAASGSYLALFLAIHVGAVMAGRHVFGLDTNFYFAAAGFHVAPFGVFFAPYYFLAVVTLFAHLGCAAYWIGPGAIRQRTVAVAAPALVGSVVAGLLVLTLAGRLQPFEVPAPYKATFIGAGGSTTR